MCARRRKKPARGEGGNLGMQRHQAEGGQTRQKKPPFFLRRARAGAGRRRQREGAGGLWRRSGRRGEREGGRAGAGRARWASAGRATGRGVTEEAGGSKLRARRDFHLPSPSFRSRTKCASPRAPRLPPSPRRAPAQRAPPAPHACAGCGAGRRCCKAAGGSPWRNFFCFFFFLFFFSFPGSVSPQPNRAGGRGRRPSGRGSLRIASASVCCCAVPMVPLAGARGAPERGATCSNVRPLTQGAQQCRNNVVFDGARRAAVARRRRRWRGLTRARGARLWCAARGKRAESERAWCG